jgi:cysteine desulfurase
LLASHMERVYFDFNATTPLAPEVAEAMRAYLDGEFGNASSHHWAGERVRQAIESARQQVATLLRCESGEVVFTSGGTEANNFALAGVFFGQHGRTRPHFIASSIEHPSIANTCAYLERLGAGVTRVPVDNFGLVDPDAVQRAICSETVLISIMHSNNEVGTIQPIKEVAAIARQRGVLMHCDAAQSAGKVPLDVADLGIDLLTVAGHKMYAPQGVGALFIRQGVQLEPLLHGAGHERGRRAGTENVLEIAGLGAACTVAERWIDDPKICELRDLFWQLLRERFGQRVALNGHPQQRLPNTLNVSFRNQNGHQLLSQIPVLAASTGSACHAGNHQLSPVLMAMGVPESLGMGAIRFSLGRSSTRAEIEAVVERLANVMSGTG